MRLTVLLTVLLLTLAGCSAKSKAKFEDVSDHICDAVEEYGGMVEMGASMISKPVPRLVLEIGMEEAKHRCKVFRMRTEEPE